jgi:maltose alpha-D-glucosyltransferase/alpha-amylase
MHESVDPSGNAPWWESAVVYCLDVETYDDSDGDGVGDLAGLRRRLDYLQRLGVTCLWLLPIFATPNCDDGYDITDHCAIDPRLGTLEEFDALVRDCDERGLEVVLELIANHTSDEHPWFVEARRDPGSPAGAYYVWSDVPLPEPQSVVFPGEVDGSWTYDEVARRYFLHRYYPFQPDLDHGNPAVSAEIERIAAFWLDRGVAGFRVDSAPFVIEQVGWRHRLDDPHEILRRWRRFAESRRDDVLLVAEAYFRPPEQMPFFGQGDEFQALLHFHLNNCAWLALARREAEPLRRALEETPSPPPGCGWLTFLRSHDELTVEKLEDEERADIFRELAPLPEMQIYGRGTRRRTAAMLGHDERRIRLALSLLLSLPGTPVLLYGDEIGLDEDLSLHGRMSVRVPMRWSSGWNAGFSSAPAAELVRPVRESPRRGVDVWSQEGDPGSLLHWTRRAIAARRVASPGWGTAVSLQTGDEAVFAHRCDGPGGALLAVHNLADTGREVAVDVENGTAEATELLADRDYDAPAPGEPLAFTIAPYGFRWLRLERADARERGSRRSSERASR